MRILNALLETSIYTSILFVCIVLFQKCFRKKLSPKLQYALWFLVIARLCIPVTFESGLHLIRVPVPAAQEQQLAEPSLVTPIADAPLAGSPVSQMEPLHGVPALEHPGTSTVGLHAEPTRPAPVALSWEQILLGIWVLGAIGYWMYLGVCSLRMRRALKEALTPPDQMLQVYESVKDALHVNANVDLLLLYNITTPALTASIRPKLIVPADLEFDDTQLRFILSHELMHVQRRDHLVCLLLRVLEALYWFHPVVWLMQRQLIADMETACDYDVVHALAPEDKSGYARTLLYLFSQQRPAKFVLGMALVKTEKNAEARIRGIYRRGKTKASVRALSALLILMLVTACFTTACQPTPDAPIVVNKNDGKLDDAIRTTSQPGDQAQDIAYEERTYTGGFTGADQSVTINIDAKVLEPAGNVPVVEVAPCTFDMDLIKRAANVLFQGNTAYDVQVGMSKEDLMAEILRTKQHIADDQKLLDYYNGDREIADEVKVEFERRIREYEALYESAPDTIERKPTEWKFHPWKDYLDMTIFGQFMDPEDEQSQALINQYNNSERIELETDIGGNKAKLVVMNYGDEKRVSNFMQFELTDPTSPRASFDYSVPMTMDLNQSAAFAQLKLEQMGLKYMRFYEGYGFDSEGAMLQNPDDQAYGYTLYFVPSYEGVPALRLGPGEGVGDTTYGPWCEYESLHVTVANNQIVYLYWESPFQSVQVENANVALLPFEDIMKVFEQQMRLTYTLEKLSRFDPESPDYQQYVNSLSSGQIEINTIRLGLMRIAIPGRIGAYRMVPAWEFYGTEKTTKNDDAQNFPQQQGTWCYLTVNAIDGSVIDRARGY